MSRGYTSDGRRLSSMTHATRGHTCPICGRIAYGNGGEVSHGRAHVRRGEAVELFKETEYTSNRVFLATGDEGISWFAERGYEVVKP